MTKVTQIEPQEKTPRTADDRPLTGRTQALSPFEEMDRMFDQIRSQLGFGGWPWRLDRPHWPEFAGALGRAFPRVELLDRDEALVLRADIPGVRKEDVEVSLTDDAVTLSGHTVHEQEGEGERRYHETYRGEFSRTIGLPANVDGDRVTATYENGVLELVMPKMEKTRRRTIEVK